MKFWEFVIFAVFTAVLHDLLVKWEIRNNIELFKDLEVPPRWRKNAKKKRTIRER